MIQYIYDIVNILTEKCNKKRRKFSAFLKLFKKILSCSVKVEEFVVPRAGNNLAPAGEETGV